MGIKVAAAVGLLALALGRGALAAPVAPLIVDIVQGRLEGAPLGTEGGAFLGVPFARPPVGAARWRAPRPAARWAGTRPAKSFGHSCMQADGGWNHDAASDASEDCLYLNVYTPSLRRGARLPVMVWIHGGAFSGGSGSQEIYQGLPIASRGVLLITINYRLNVFGFLAHPAMKDGLTANFGLADQIAALRWVKANAAAFGGDPANVTIFGQSAGGMSVVSLMASPQARGLFRQAIVESGAILKLPPPSLETARARAARFGDGMSLKQLRALPATDLLERFQASLAAAPGSPVPFGPVIDGQVLPEDPAAVFARHAEAPVPLLIGSNAREGLPQPGAATLAAALDRAYGPLAAEATAHYRESPDDPVLGSTTNQIETDTGFRCGAVVLAALHAGSGAPTWQYQFEQSLPGLEAQGAQHSFELPYVFGSLPAPGKILGGSYTAADRALSDRMIDLWTNFARTGAPGGGSEWPKFTLPDRAYLRLSTSAKPGADASRDLRGAQCSLFERSLAR